MTTVTSGEILNVSGGKTSIGIIVLSGGTLNVLSGGTISDTASVGGQDIIYSGGSAFATIVTDNGSETVSGTAISTTVSNGGTEFVSSGGTISGTVVGTGGQDVIYAGGRAFVTSVTNLV